MSGPVKRTASLAVLSGVVVLMALGLASCAKPPEAEMTAAQAAIDQAMQREAAEYAPGELRAAQDSLAAARSEIDRQNAKFALFRRYGDAKAKAIAAQNAGNTAGEAAVRNKEQARQDAEQALAQVQQAIADVRARLDSPEGRRLARGKEARQAIEQIRTEIDATEASLENVRQLQAQERYKQALAQAQQAIQRTQQLNNEIQAAMDKMTGAATPR